LFLYFTDYKITITENSENQLNPIIIRIRKPYKNENAPYLSFPRKRESRKIITKKWIPDAVYPCGSRGRNDTLL